MKPARLLHSGGPAKLCFLLFFLISIGGIGQTEPDSTHAGTNSLTGKWKLVEFRNIITRQVTDTSSVQNGSIAFFKKVKLTFQDNGDSGIIQGTSFCNDVGGNYKIHGKNKITVSEFGGTMVGCLYEGKLWDGMHAASSYRRTNDTLLILYNDDSEEMVFTTDSNEIKK